MATNTEQPPEQPPRRGLFCASDFPKPTPEERRGPRPLRPVRPSPQLGLAGLEPDADEEPDEDE